MDNVVRLEYAYGVCPKCNRGDYLRYLIRNDGLINKPYEIKCINCNSYFTYVECRCEIDDHYIGYVECFEHWCRRWAKDHTFDDMKEEVYE